MPLEQIHLSLQRIAAGDIEIRIAAVRQHDLGDLLYLRGECGQLAEVLVQLTSRARLLSGVCRKAWPPSGSYEHVTPSHLGVEGRKRIRQVAIGGAAGARRSIRG